MKVKQYLSDVNIVFEFVDIGSKSDIWCSLFPECFVDFTIS